MTDTAPAGFEGLGLPSAQIENLTSLGYSRMTDVQALALPPALAGQDLIAQAHTGSGKTAAFGIALLTRLTPRDFGTQALVLCPTRELSTQVATQLRKLARYLPNIKVAVLCGGQAIGPQIGSLAHGAHVVVGTPGRLRDHLEKETLVLERCNTVVLDEADRMLDMGFADDIAFILGQTPETRQTLLFSATYPDNIASLAAQYLRAPTRVEAAPPSAAPAIRQRFFRCDGEGDDTTRANACAQLLQHFAPTSCVVFCNTRQSTVETAAALEAIGYVAMALHGEMEQRERDQVLIQFRNGSCQILVATDVAARGLDVEELPLVVNAELPRDPDVYTHRIGRTGRAGLDGLAVSLFFDREFARVERLALSDTADIAPLAGLQAGQPLPGAPRQTLCIAGGRKQKIRAGDILGALTAEQRLASSAIGRIDILEFTSFVAIDIACVAQALEQLETRRIKGQKFKVRRLHTIASRRRAQAS